MSSANGKRRVLVTGGAGFIGANLVRSLIAEKWSVTVLDDLSTGRREYVDALATKLVCGDILDRALTARVVAGHDAVVHLAAQTGVPGSLADPRRDCAVNVIGTLNMLEASRAAGVRRFVFASSNAPLGRQKPPVDETKAPLPISPYGAGKLAGEAYCLAYQGSWGLGTVVLRFANVYGPFSFHKSSVVAKFFKDLLGGRKIEIFGDGQQTRDFLYVGDLCRAIMAALDSETAGEVFQIATGQPTAIVDLAEQIQSVAAIKTSFRYAPPRQGDMRQNYSAISKARSMLNWQPSVSLAEGLCETWNWFRHGPE